MEKDTTKLNRELIRLAYLVFSAIIIIAVLILAVKQLASIINFKVGSYNVLIIVILLVVSFIIILYKKIKNHLKGWLKP